MQANKDTVDHPVRLHHLDAARGLATISVITIHFLMAVYGLNETAWYFTSPFRFLWYGEAGILFFFVHSGFILSYAFTRHQWPFGVRSYARFLVERIFRIYPLFLAILILSFIAVNTTGPYIGTSSQDWIAKFWYSDFTVTDLLKEAILIFRYPESANLRLIPQDWTLTIELLAGAAIPLLAVAGKKNLLYFILLMAVLKITNVLTTYIFEFGLGVLIFLWWENITKLWQRISLPIKIAVAVTALVCYFGFFQYPSLYTKFNVILGSASVDRLVVDIGCVFVFIILLSSIRVQKWLSAPQIAFLGKICYSIYLTHKLLLLIFWRTFQEYFTNLHQQSTATITGVYISYLVIVVVISAACYRLIEKPMNMLGKKFAALLMPRHNTAYSKEKIIT